MRWIPIHRLADRLGDLCKVLPAVHHLTGSDYTGKFGSKYAALKANPERYLSEFGQSLLEPNLSKTLSSDEEYLVQVLKKDSTCKTMNELRKQTYFHSKGSLELPPTSGAVRLHILRACLATNTMVSLMQPLPLTQQIEPTMFGYIMEDDLLVLDKGTNPLPGEYTVHCGCIKCASTRCSCRRAAVLCSQFCEFDNECQNVFSVLIFCC